MDLPQQVYWNAEQYGKFSALIHDYLLENDSVKEFYFRFPSEKALIEQAKEKLSYYSHREIVSGVLEKQHSDLDLSQAQLINLEKFKQPNSVTITTGHQLNLLTGPLYFLHKISQVLKCCDSMNQKYPDFNFIPIFWMATEDHDFEEINHFYFKDKKFSWNRNSGGAVGRMKLDGIEGIFENFFKELPESIHGREIKELIKESYLASENLTQATMKLVQKLFGERGLLMIDGDDKELKKLMISSFKDDLVNHTAFKTVSETDKKLENKGYHLQVHPREINLFYLNDDLRERIIFEDGKYKVLNTGLSFTESEIIDELNKNPERFSPNVILRPLYQETILPNLAYIGGSGEMAYWLQLKDLFESRNILLPLITVRNSLLFIDEKQKEKLEKLSISYKDLFKPIYQIINENISENSNIEIDFENYKKQLEQMFDELNEKAQQTDITFSKMVDAQRTKQLNGLDKMVKRLIKAEKIKHSNRVRQIEKIYSELFPRQNLQEREVNFTEFYLEYGKSFADEIYNEINEIDFRFIIRVLP